MGSCSARAPSCIVSATAAAHRHLFGKPPRNALNLSLTNSTRTLHTARFWSEPRMPMSSKRVLIVDDDATIREMLVSVLRRRDLTVDVAGDGKEALDLLKEHRYSVVLLDLLMPNVDGFGVIDNLDSAISTPLVLVITGADRALIRPPDPQPIHRVANRSFDAE